MQTKCGTIQGVAYRYCLIRQRSDGYSYMAA